MVYLEDNALCKKSSFIRQEKMKFLRLTIFMAHTMHIINMHSNIKYWENICNRLRDIQQKKKVQVGKDQEKAQSERDAHSKNRGEKKPN